MSQKSHGNKASRGSGGSSAFLRDFKDNHKPHDAKLDRMSVGSTPGHGGVSFPVHDHIDKSVMPNRSGEQGLSTPLRRGEHEGKVSDTGSTGE